MTLINDLVTFLANPPGNFVYILALAFTLIGSFQGALSQWRMTGYPQSRRLVLGLGLLLAFQLVLFLISGLLEQEIVVGRELLPIFDRAVVLLSLIWLIWLWAFPEPTRSGDAASMLMSLLVLAAAALGSVMYLSGSPVIGTFNASEQAFYWDLGGIVIAVMGLIVLIVRKPAQWGTGFAVAALALVGFGVDILFPTSEGDFSGIVRFCMLAAFPLLFSLSTRFPTSYSHQPVPVVSVEQSSVSNETQPQQDANGQEEQDTRERRRYSTDPKTLQSLLALAADPDGTKINQHIARSIAQSLLVDLCFLIYLGDDKNSLYIATGYDLIREENLDGKHTKHKIRKSYCIGNILRVVIQCYK